MILRHADSKPRKDTIESVLARNPEILALIERERAQRQLAWEADLIGGLVHSEGLPEDVARVAAKHSRTFETGSKRAWSIMHILRELNQQ
jgi:hypothetical protein